MDAHLPELEFAKKLAREAGAIMRHHFGHAKIDVKSNDTPVTQADLEVSDLVISRIKESFPDHHVMDEERQNKSDGGEYLWICDPIDGTIPYAHAVATSVFSLALYQNKEPILGVAYDPYMDRMCWTARGMPTSLNDTMVTVSPDHIERGSTIFFVSSYIETVDTTKFIAHWRNQGVNVSAVESFVYLAMLVASGYVQAAVLPPAHPWDRAASKILLENAGGMMLDHTGAPADVFTDPPHFCVLSNAAAKDQILESLTATMLQS